MSKAYVLEKKTDKSFFSEGYQEKSIKLELKKE